MKHVLLQAVFASWKFEISFSFILIFTRERKRGYDLRSDTERVQNTDDIGDETEARCIWQRLRWGSRLLGLADTTQQNLPSLQFRKNIFIKDFIVQT